ncbi:MAG: hypothetical protein DI539_20435 [Flavobacterium psychrophilum]|nr:MAG: hypothetical protein DI539_20435 [Flavobacterium psychrophilum]
MADMVIGNNLLSIYSTYAEHYTVDASYLQIKTQLKRNTPPGVSSFFEQSGTSGNKQPVQLNAATNYKPQTKVSIMY